MNRSEVLKGAIWEKGERRRWPPLVKLMLAFLVGFLLLTPATLGLYWDWFLPK